MSRSSFDTLLTVPLHKPGLPFCGCAMAVPVGQEASVSMASPAGDWVERPFSWPLQPAGQRPLMAESWRDQSCLVTRWSDHTVTSHVAWLKQHRDCCSPHSHTQFGVFLRPTSRGDLDRIAGLPWWCSMRWTKKAHLVVGFS